MNTVFISMMGVYAQGCMYCMCCDLTRELHVCLSIEFSFLRVFLFPFVFSATNHFSPGGCKKLHFRPGGCKVFKSVWLLKSVLVLFKVKLNKLSGDRGARHAPRGSFPLPLASGINYAE